MAIDLGELATAIGKIILRFRVRRNTGATWTATNEVLLDGEVGWDRTANKIKIGNGVDGWNTLAYVGGSGGGGASGVPLSPDVAPASPNPYDDEFDVGSTIDTTGARRSGALAWTVQTSSGTTAPIVAQGYVGADTATVTGNLLMLQTMPGGDCTFVAKVKRVPTTSNSGFEIGFYNSANGKSYSAQLFSSPSLVTERGTFNTSTWVYTGSTNPFTDNVRYATVIDGWMYLRIRLSGTNIFAAWSGTGHDADWFEATAEPQATWLSGAPTHVSLFIPHGNRGVCDWFRRTA